jgi:fucose permease
MFERIWNTLKQFFSKPEVSEFITQHLFYLFLIGLAVVLVLIVLVLIKTNKEIKEMNKNERKRGKSLLKFLSNKKNKTY